MDPIDRIIEACKPYEWFVEEDGSLRTFLRGKRTCPLVAAVGSSGCGPLQVHTAKRKLRLRLGLAYEDADRIMSAADDTRYAGIPCYPAIRHRMMVAFNLEKVKDATH